MIRGYQNFLFSNGKKIEGGYHHNTGMFHGFKKFCLILGIEDFRNYNLVLFTYEHDKTTKVSVFDDEFVEVMFPGSPISAGICCTVTCMILYFLSSICLNFPLIFKFFSLGFNSHNPTVFGRIEILVKPFHMYKYSYGVVGVFYDRF